MGAGHSERVPDMETAAAWAARLDPGVLIEIADAGRDEIQCRDHLLTSKIDDFGERKPVLIGEWIARAAGWSGEAMGFGRAEANKVLQGYGLRVIEAEGAPYLLIASVTVFRRNPVLTFRRTPALSDYCCEAIVVSWDSVRMPRMMRPAS